MALIPSAGAGIQPAAAGGVGVPVTGNKGFAELFGFAGGNNQLLSLLMSQLGKRRAPMQPRMLPMYRPGSYQRMKQGAPGATPRIPM